MTKRHLKNWLICTAVVVPLTALAEPPSGGVGRRPGERDRYGQDRGPGGGFGRGQGGDWNSDEWKQFRAELEAFCQQNSPNRWREFQSQGRAATGDQRHRLMAMSQRFRYLQTLKKQDAELYDLQVAQIRVEDAEYGKLVELKDIDPSDKKKVDEIKGALREKNKEYIALRLKERAHRIDRLAKLIEKERQALANDSDDAAQTRLVDQRLDQMVNEGPDFFNPKPSKRGGDNNNNDAGAPAATSPVHAPPGANAGQ